MNIKFNLFFGQNFIKTNLQTNIKKFLVLLLDNLT